MKNTLISLATLLLCTISVNSSAQNLVPNPGMETFVACPTATNYYVDRASNWLQLTGHGGTADYFNSCGAAQHDWTNFSDNNAVVPHGGNAYIGMGTYDDLAQREYAEIQLTAPLVAGETYEVSAWVYGARGDFASNVYTDQIGIYLSATDPSVSGCGMCVGVYSVTPAVVSTAVTQNNWTQISGNYVATGGEQYLVLGNFSSNAATTVVNNGAPSMGGNAGYTYFDDVEVVLANPLPSTLINFTTECSTDQNTKTAFWTSASESNMCEYILQEKTKAGWTDIYSTNAIGNSTSNTYYSAVLDNDGRESYLRLKMIDCDGTYELSNVILSTCDASDDILISSVGGTSPYGLVTGLQSDKSYQLDVFNAMGQSILKADIHNSSQYKIEALTSGIYHVQIKQTDSDKDFATGKLLIGQ